GNYAVVYGRLKQHFRASSYSAIADERFTEVLAFLREEQVRARRALDTRAAREGYLRLHRGRQGLTPSPATTYRGDRSWQLPRCSLRLPASFVAGRGRPDRSANQRCVDDEPLVVVFAIPPTPTRYQIEMRLECGPENTPHRRIIATAHVCANCRPLCHLED